MKFDPDRFRKQLDQAHEAAHHKTGWTEARLIKLIRSLCVETREGHAEDHGVPGLRWQGDLTDYLMVALEDVAASVRCLPRGPVQAVPGIEMTDTDTEWLHDLADHIEAKLRTRVRPIQSSPSSPRRGRQSKGRAAVHAELQAVGITSKRERDGLIKKALRRRR